MRAYIVYHCHTGDRGYADWEDVIIKHPCYDGNKQVGQSDGTAANQS